jgi:hypothetical protein
MTMDTFSSWNSIKKTHHVDFGLFKPVRSEPLHDSNRKFLHIPFANKGIDAINISNILNRKEVVKEIPPYFKNQYGKNKLHFDEMKNSKTTIRG